MKRNEHVLPILDHELLNIIFEHVYNKDPKIQRRSLTRSFETSSSCS